MPADYPPSENSPVDVVRRTDTDFKGTLEREGFDPLSMTIGHAVHAGELPGKHHDPFDRMLIAQAHIESMAVIGKDKIFDQYGIDRIW